MLNKYNIYKYRLFTHYTNSITDWLSLPVQSHNISCLENKTYTYNSNNKLCYFNKCLNKYKK